MMPAAFGGLVRYNEEYDSKLKVGPGAVVGLAIAVAILLTILKYTA